MKKLISLICVLAMVLALCACGASEPAAPADNDSESYVVGICQLVQHPALDAGTQGFKDALTEALGAENVTFLDQNAQGDSNTCSTIVNDFVSKNVDMILGNATAALQAAANATQTIPVLGTAITEYGTMNS